MQPVITAGVLDSLYNWLYECAHDGSLCPTNQDICDRYGFKSWSTASKAVWLLQNQGKITVMRFNRARQVYIVSTKKLTPLPEIVRPALGLDALPPRAKKNKPPRPNEKPSPRPKPMKEKNRTKAAGAASTTAPATTATVRSQRTVDLPKLVDRRAEELRQIADFEAAGKVYKARMGETLLEYDDEGVSKAARAKLQAAAVRKAAARAARTQAMLESMGAKR